MLDTVLISEIEGVRKPELEAFSRAAERLAVNLEESVFVGDNPDDDVRGSKNAGMRAVWVRDSWWPQPVEADAVVDHVEGVLSVVAGWASTSRDHREPRPASRRSCSIDLAQSECAGRPANRRLQLKRIALASILHEVTMIPKGRKLLLTTHITVSVGWIGAVLAYLALVIAAMTGQSDQLLRAAWMALELIGWYVIVPLALAALVTGIGIALRTPWGLLRHYWVATSLLLTVVAAAVLLQHMSTVTLFAGVAADAAIADIRDILRPALRGELLHAGVGLVVLLAITTLNVYKPRGLTAYGRRRSGVIADSRSRSASRPESGWGTPVRTPRWVHAVWIHAAALLLLLAILHVAGGLRLHS
jgi:hypothetical protein